ncbi:MAG: sulfate adenylyltransferase subunit CysN [Planctomycetota bacterium]
MKHAEGIDRYGIEGYLERYGDKGLLRFITCGSVDDGKSTLIGRLLHDSENVFDDHLRALTKDSEKHGTTGEGIDFALLVDGLAAEREQGITIDVAYRYFATERRKFIIADCPGHEQYTRNMATGASTCDLAVLMIDARLGVLDQTRRHAFICSLLGIRHIIVAINKMDLVDWSEDRFMEIRQQFSAFAAKLQVPDVHFIPLSALMGENVVNRSAHMEWYQGSPLLDHLETVHVASDRNLIDLRLAVQQVVRPDLNFRGFAGSIASGIVRVGDSVVALPSGQRSTVKSIVTWEGELEEAFAPMAVTLTLADEIDVSRGDVIAAVNNAPRMATNLEAMMVWMGEDALEIGKRYLAKVGSSTVQAVVREVRYRANVHSLHRESSDALTLNEIGRVALELVRPVTVDSYNKNRGMGSMILIDRESNSTVACGMIVDRVTAETSTSRRRDAGDARSNVRAQRSKVPAAARAQRLGQAPFILWFTGLPRSGKSSIAYALEEVLFKEGHLAHVLDGENLRLGLNRDLGFSAEDRWENQRRVAELARIQQDTGVITLTALVSPLAADRAEVRRILGDRAAMVFCDAALEVCESRDEEGLYRRARAKEIRNVTGIDAPYERPTHADLTLDTAAESIVANVERVMVFLRQRGWIGDGAKA